MSSEALVQLALEALGCTQKDLALQLGVSATQISKWKKGEHISFEMEKKLRNISSIGDQDPQFIVWSSSRENATKWDNLIRSLAKLAESSGETGYITEPLVDNYDFLCWEAFYVLRQMGVEIPKVFPAELDVSKESDEELEAFLEAVEGNKISSLIYDIFKSLTDVYGFYVAYVADLANDVAEFFDLPAEEIEPNLMSLAASKLDVSLEVASNFKNFKYDTERNYERWLGVVKDRAFRAGIPLRAELLNLVYSNHDSLGHEAEAESLGFNVSRLHPDIYMNELLEGMRVIHQILPAIMKKLGIDEEFQLDASALRIS
ncbi:helix-turn-helix domain-containing protein [Pseudomonas syringae]|uniref:helix-turn-helix domain-containing protein n=1 Tax=Pseudomonas syringae TaxID=317 RepID=UPI0004638FC1|nr:helix-turn-helix transcriptional regulator [Pseudomonas syringae]